MSEQSPEPIQNLVPIVKVGIILADICGISLYIRIAPSYDQIFVNDWVWFRETDAYYHIRNIEVLVNHFPDFNTFDPYWRYTVGGPGLIRPFFDWLIAGTVLLVSRGAPTFHTIEVVGAYMPAILGTLALIPVYFIGKELFNRWVGLISAALVAILPSEFLHRSLLGFTDHHGAEVLFSAVCILFLIMAIKRAREREISFGHLLSRDWPTITKPLIYTLLAGVFLGIYLLTWQGGLLLAFTIFVYLVIQFTVDHLRHKSSDYLCIVGTPFFLIAFLMLIPVLGESALDIISRVALPVAIVVPIVLSVISRLMAGKTWKPVYYPLILLGLAGIGLAALHVINPSLFQSILGQFSIFRPTGAMLTVWEMEPLTPSIAWGYFTTSFFIAFISFAMLIYVAIKEKSADKTLFLVWSIVILMLTLGTRRYTYYYVVNAALLTGYFSWKMLDIAGLRKLLVKSKEVVGAVKKFKKREKKRRGKAEPKTFMQPRGAWVRVILVGIVIFFLVFFPNIDGVEALARRKSLIYGDLAGGWYSACLWLKDNTPEPFDDPDFYYELYLPKDEFEYPETAYGVMSWWDYGYYIMQIAHRIPNANPGQAGAREAGQFFTAQNESSANKIADRYDSRYVMIDYATATGKFYAMVDWAGGNLSEFHEYYGVPPQVSGGTPQWFVWLFYPPYYKSTVARLYNFDGEAAVPAENCWVVLTWDGESVWIDLDIKYKNIIADPKYFSSYEEAEAYVSSQQSGNYAIGGLDPFATIVPLEKLDSYELVYQSETEEPVKIFKYLGSSES